ncbi:MAG TPA: HDOD domain-containing protein [Candidatus Krumholzibacteria bacterium]|nr:HDOD domain-containing protein [Candidatus Krumholzibacteria bacterium]HPD71603.1 HDOD domain-containing protein [Candidatus Krumholzibacteria bacterium]HRY41464.1 HDOD domain-containing protein [Candidatus Krumholzibacteria bacterium]
MRNGGRRTTLEQLRDSVTDLPTIPETLSRLLKLLEDPNSGARDLAEVIRYDAPLASKILRMANSPLYPKQRSLKTVQECVSVLGYRTVRQVALCVSVVSTLARECDRRRSVLDYRDLWRHCASTGAVAQQLAYLAGDAEPEVVLTCGLLHDLGKFVLTLNEPRDYAELLRARCDCGRPLVEIEREAMGYDHAQAGAALAEAWNFPAVLVATIGHHHDLAVAEPPVGLVGLADYLANLLDPATSDLGFDAMVVKPAPLYAAAGLDRDSVESRLDPLRKAIADSSLLHDLD